MTIYDTPLQYEQAASPSAGLRSSTECVSKRYLEFVDPDRFPPFNEGVGAVGHLFADLWIKQAFGEYEHAVEVPLPWNHGCSHIDAVVYDGPHAGAYEIKTTSKNPADGPSAANRRQVQRMLYLCEQNGIELPGPFRIVMIGKSGNDSGWVRGPWTVTLPDAEREAIAAEFALIDAWMQTTPDETDLRAACKCGGCFPKERVFVEGVEADRAMTRIDEARKLMLAAQDAKKEADAAYKTLKAEYDALRKAIAAIVPDDKIVTDGYIDVSKRRDGVVLVREARA